MAKSILLYGETGTFKTSQIKYLARYIYERYGKTTRVIFTGASDGDLTKPEENAGIVESYRISSLTDPLPAIRKLAKGYWPRVAEVGGKYVLQFVEPSAETWKKVGAIVLDSLTTVGDIAMRDVVDKGRKIAEEVVSVFQEKITIVATGSTASSESVEQFGAPARAHYNFVQNLTYGIVNAMSSLPVEAVMFTCLEAKSEEEDRTTIYGPSIAGKKATPKVPSWVGDCLHHDSYQVPKLVPAIDIATGKPKLDAANKPVMETVYETRVRVYFMRHPDPKSGINFPAKPRVPSEKWPELMARFPGGYFEPTYTSGLDMLLKVEDELEGGATDALKEWRTRIDAARSGAVSTK